MRDRALVRGSGWTGVKGPQFSPGWDFYPATLNSDSYTDMFLYNPVTGASWVEFSNGHQVTIHPIHSRLPALSCVRVGSRV